MVFALGFCSMAMKFSQHIKRAFSCLLQYHCVRIVFSPVKMILKLVLIVPWIHFTFFSCILVKNFESLIIEVRCPWLQCLNCRLFKWPKYLVEIWAGNLKNLPAQIDFLPAPVDRTGVSVVHWEQVKFIF